MSTSGVETVRACVEVYRDRELPSTLRNHPVIRRFEELAFLVTFVENDLVGLEQDEADRAPTTWSGRSVTRPDAPAAKPSSRYNIR
jgi:heptaprenyl diphosphate synthase